MNISIEETTSMKGGTIMDRLLQEITDWMRTTEERVNMGVSGHGRAGNTTLTRKRIKELGKDNVNYLNTHPYMIESEVRKNTVIESPYEHKQHQCKMTACHPAAHPLPSLE